MPSIALTRRILRAADALEAFLGRHWELVIAGLLAVAMLILSGCAADPFDWQAKADHQPLPAIFVTVARGEPERICGKPAWGCAKRDYSAGICFIYVTDDAQPWLRSHELLHCAGYSHD